MAGKVNAMKIAAIGMSLLLAGATHAAKPEYKPVDPTVVGRIVVKGAVPAPQPLGPGKDACCQEAKPHDRSLLVGPEGGLANVVVTLEIRRDEREPKDLLSPIDPLTREMVTYVLTNKGCAFKPRVLIVRTGHPLVLANDDPTMHNVNIDFIRNPAVNVVVEPDGRREIVLQKAEPKPVPVRCNVHTFMAGWIVVRDNVLTASVSNDKGKFRLSLLSAGEWRLRFWHEGKALEGLEVAGSKTDRRGEVMVTLPEGGGPLDLGEIVIPVEKL